MNTFIIALMLTFVAPCNTTILEKNPYGYIFESKKTCRVYKNRHARRKAKAIKRKK